MCGIVGAVAEREVAQILLEGLRRLEYRGYDSAGMVTLNQDNQLTRLRSLGKVKELEAALAASPLSGRTGIAHTRWATHGKPCEANAHPHMSGEEVALVHNGIIENYQELRELLVENNYELASETDTEIVVHLIDHHLKQSNDFLSAVQQTVSQLKGAYSLAITHKQHPGRLIAVRSGSPLVLGVGIGEFFVASDSLALLPVTNRFVYLEEGDIADVKLTGYQIFSENGVETQREINTIDETYDSEGRGKYRHYMQKEIFQQPDAVRATLEGRLTSESVLPQIFGDNAAQLFEKIKNVQIVACGTSYHAGMVARYWLESLAGVSCRVEIASEFRYREKVVLPNTLFVCISQSGETADTLAALQQAKQMDYLSTLAICNVAESSLVRESDFCLLTRAGREIGVASTKAFTTQLIALLLLTVSLGRYNKMSLETEQQIVKQCNDLPNLLEQTLKLDGEIKKLSHRFVNKQHMLFLGRGVEYPIALEGALKLKELSYIHAEAYPAGELKHGPLALIDENMPVVAVAPNDQLLEKLQSNIQEVKARGGELIVFADQSLKFEDTQSMTIINLPTAGSEITPIIYTIPLQLLAYHVAVIKGTDVDQPRNLAKSVTVE